MTRLASTVFFQKSQARAKSATTKKARSLRRIDDVLACAARTEPPGRERE